MVVGSDTGLGSEPRIFAPLRALQIVVAWREDRRGIGHRRIEPALIEGVAEIVMRMDVAARTPAAVAVQEMPDALPDAQSRTTRRELPAGHVIGQKQQQECPQIRAIPFLLEIPF